MLSICMVKPYERRTFLRLKLPFSYCFSVLHYRDNLKSNRGYSGVSPTFVRGPGHHVSSKSFTFASKNKEKAAYYITNVQWNYVRSNQVPKSSLFPRVRKLIHSHKVWDSLVGWSSSWQIPLPRKVDLFKVWPTSQAHTDCPFQILGTQVHGIIIIDNVFIHNLNA